MVKVEQDIYSDQIEVEQDTYFRVWTERLDKDYTGNKIRKEKKPSWEKE